MIMQRYIQQLIQDFEYIAKTRKVEQQELDVEELFEQIENSKIIPPEEKLGISYMELPPADMLNTEELTELTKAIEKAIIATGTEIAYPDEGKAPPEIRYKALREHFKEGFNSMPGWTIDFCSGNCPDCVFYKYCDSGQDLWTEEDIEAEKK